MSKKLVKLLAGVAAVGAAVAGVYYWFKKKSDTEFEDEFEDEFDVDEFELDEDLKEVSDRGYTPLNTADEESAPSEEVPEEPEVTIAE